MILKALYDYYHRSGNLPIMGMELKEIGIIGKTKSTVFQNKKYKKNHGV